MQLPFLAHTNELSPARLAAYCMRTAVRFRPLWPVGTPCQPASCLAPALLPQSTLLGLLGACNSELSILRCASRVMGSDGARILAGGYRECSSSKTAKALS